MMPPGPSKEENEKWNTFDVLCMVVLGALLAVIGWALGRQHWHLEEASRLADREV